MDCWVALPVLACSGSGALRGPPAAALPPEPGLAAPAPSGDGCLPLPPAPWEVSGVVWAVAAAWLPAGAPPCCGVASEAWLMPSGSLPAAPAAACRARGSLPPPACCEAAPPPSRAGPVGCVPAAALLPPNLQRQARGQRG